MTWPFLYIRFTSLELLHACRVAAHIFLSETLQLKYFHLRPFMISGAFLDTPLSEPQLWDTLIERN